MGETSPSSRARAAAASRGVAYLWTGSECRSGDGHSPTAAADHQPRSSSSVHIVHLAGDNNAEERAMQAATTAAATSPPARVRFLYQDEETRARICKNAQALVDGLQRDRASTTVNAQVARKALSYRRLMGRFSDLDPEDTRVDISAFLGIEWRRVADASPTAAPECADQRAD